MDAPSPQSVGREFVRQYYTLLNKAPDHLHRFYNNSSSFVHGGLEPQNREATLVVGQKNIHNKIQQLNFRDCHAKISQVDSQSTLGNGVVVQVTGELSNDGQPMRRFTQTFVLAAQAPKKYYVHNDIFRYQDLYTDEENDGENRSENDEDQDGENVVENIQPHQQPIYYPAGQPIQGYPQQQPQLQQQQQMNGAVHDDLQPGLVNQSIQTPTIPQQLTLPADPNNISTMPPVQNKIVEAVESVPQQPALAMDSEISYEQNLPLETEPTKDDNQPEKIIREDSKCDTVFIIRTFSNIFINYSIQNHTNRTTFLCKFIEIRTQQRSQFCSGYVKFNST